MKLDCLIIIREHISEPYSAPFFIVVFKILFSAIIPFCSSLCFDNVPRISSYTFNLYSGGARPQNLRGHLRGKLIFWRGKIEFLKRYCYLPMPLSQDFSPPPPPGDSSPSQKGAIFLRIPPPGDEYPRNIAPPPPRGANAPGISPPPPLGYSPPIYAMWFIQIIS